MLFRSPRTTIEYRTPTANAITTSYQPLSGFLSRNKLKLPPSQPTVAPLPKTTSLRVPFGGSASAKPLEPQQSKLAMKGKSSRTKANTAPELEDSPVAEVLIFSPSAVCSYAPPSAPAAPLVSDAPDAAEVNRSEGAHVCEYHKAERDKRRSSDRSHASEEDRRARRSSRRNHIETILPLTMPTLRGFAFDVYNALKGTSLAQRSTSSTASSAFSASVR